MNSSLLYIVYHFVRLLPDTRCFGLKRILYRLCGATIGRNVKICSSVRILGNSTLNLGENVWVGHETIIICSAPVIIKQNVNIAPRVYIGTGTHRIDTAGSSIAGEGLSLPITVGEGSWLCANSQILAGVSVGEHSIVAMGAVVVNNVPNRVLWGGVPGRKIKSL